MNSKILLLALTVAFLSSCSTAYKTGQTPDDVYYSAAQPQKEDNKVDKEENRDYTYSDDYYDNRYLRMKVSNRYRWNDLNDWYSYDRYSLGYNYHYGSYYNPYNSWNYYYNPYNCCCSGNNNYSNPKVASVKPIVRPTNFNLSGYTNNNFNNTNSGASKKSTIKNNNRPIYSNTNSNGSSKGAGGVIRTIFESRNDNSNSGSSNSSSSRTYSPSNSNSSNSSSSSSSGSSSGGSSGGSVTRPVRN
jgi:hypothetical protein